MFRRTRTSLPWAPRGRAVLGFGLAHAALWVPMLVLERRMSRTGGKGIVSFELAGTPERSQKTIDRWGAEGRPAARLSLLLDYPFLVSYTGLQVAGCAMASDALRRRGAERLSAAGRLIAPAQIAAGAFDAIENTALLGVLAGRRGRWPAVARATAQAKFALLVAGWLYCGLAAASRLSSR